MTEAIMTTTPVPRLRACDGAHMACQRIPSLRQRNDPRSTFPRAWLIVLAQKMGFAAVSVNVSIDGAV
jgi:hypothetical protein